MTQLVGDEKPSLDDLIQYGVKGMHWGTRRAIAKKADKLKARDPKQATTREKLGVSIPSVIRNKGFNNAALKNRQKSIARMTRVADGQAKTTEVLREVGHLTWKELIKG